jgi:hypothetical protein
LRFSRGYSESEAIPPVPWIGYQDRVSAPKDRGVKQSTIGEAAVAAPVEQFLYSSMAGAGTAIIFQYIPS